MVLDANGDYNTNQMVTTQLTKSRSEKVLITLFLSYKTLDSNVMGTSIMESFFIRFTERYSITLHNNILKTF